MNKIIIEYKEYIIKVHITESNTSIVDSYRISSIKDMTNVLNKIKEECNDLSLAIHKRSIFSMVNEWRVHNLLYSLNIKRDRTKTVDLNINQHWYIKVLYTLLSLFYFG